MVGTEVSGITIKLAAYIEDIAIITGEELDLEQIKSRLDEFMGPPTLSQTKEKPTRSPWAAGPRKGIGRWIGWVSVTK